MALRLRAAAPAGLVALHAPGEASSPAQQRGFLRRCLPCPGTEPLQRRARNSALFDQVRILVDSGSQQEPLCSAAVARRLGAEGKLVSYATQAGGQPLPIYDVGWCDLTVNGRPHPTRFRSAPIAPYDVILGETWLREHRGVLDYADNMLWQKDRAGRLQPLVLDALPHSLVGCPEVLAAAPLCAVPDGPAVMPIVSGARARRAERRHASPVESARRLGLFDPTELHAVLDFAKELPEDAELDLSDIPGVTPGPPSFDFVEADVRAQLASLPAEQIDAVVARLRVFETDVFETRTMPRPAPSRQFDVPILERPGSEPPARRPYPVAPHHQAELDRQVQVLLDAGIVRRSSSCYAAPVLFTPKKDGKLRMCVDYRLLNAQTIRDRFPTPTAADLIAKTRGAKLFSKIDLHSGFHQLRIREEDVHKTAFATPSGLYEFVTAPFGLTSVPGAFQRFMQFVLAEHIAAGYCCVYCDDIAIFSASDDPLVHLEHVEAVLRSLREHSLLAKCSKCEFMRREAEFLGFLVSGAGVRPLPSKVEAVLQIPVPDTISQLRSFLGMCNFFRAHLPLFSEVSAPLTDLLKGSKHGRQRIAWDLDCDHAFAQLKEMLTSAPLLRHFDPSLRTAVHIDASQHAVGAVLLQWEDGDLHPRPVCFLSRKFQGAQYRYDARNAESLAAQVALSTWRTLLYGVRFELVSDHASLRSLFQQKAPSHRILRLCEFLADFDFEEVKFVRGADNAVPDFLSRPWDPSRPDLTLHALSHPRLPRCSSLACVASQDRPQVLLLPVRGDQVGVHRGLGGFHLPSAVLQSSDDVLAVAQQLATSVGGSSRPLYVGSLGRVSMWRVDVGPEVRTPCLGTHVLGPSFGPSLQWLAHADLRLRADWQRSHFDALRLFGVLPVVSAASSAGAVASLAALTTAAPASALMAALLSAQQSDPFLQTVAAGLQSSDTDTWRDFFRNDEGFICYQRDQDVVPRLCVPKSCRDQVLRAAHGSVLVGHPGITRTAANVAQFFWWPNLFRDVGHYVRSCRTCATAKSSTGLRLGVDSFTSVPVQPFTHWSMDLIGPLPRSRGGNDLILTWVDRTSKFIVARALRQGNSSAKVLAELTFEAICCQYGLPARLTHDNDVRFRSLWKELWRILDTKITCTSAYNPQADPAERANRQVLEALRGAVASVTDFDQWDQALPHLCFGLNTHPSAATGTSPFELAYGFPARVPMSLDLAAHAQLTGDRGAADYALAVHNRHQAAADHVAAAQVRLGRMLDRRALPASVSVGDWMYLEASPAHSPPHQVPYKLAGRWMGPFEALEVKGPNVRLDVPPELGKITPWVHVRRLKFFEQRDADFRDDGARVQPVPAAGGALRYEIQRIWGHRPPLQLPAKEYLVQWRGYDTSQMTWVARSTLVQDVPRLLAAYETAPTTAQARPSAPKRVPQVLAPSAPRRVPQVAAHPPRRSARLLAP